MSNEQQELVSTIFCEDGLEAVVPRQACSIGHTFTEAYHLGEPKSRLVFA
jgi:hypothetical protein